MTKKSPHLNQMTATFGYTTNLYSPDAGTLTLKVAKKDWVEGASMVGVVLMNRDGIGLIELEGTVTIDGQPAKYYGLGSYFLIIENDDYQPKTIQVTSSDGTSYSYTVHAPDPVRIKSVNGVHSGTSTIDLQEDLRVELEGTDAAKDQQMTLSMLVGVPGGKDFSPFLVAKPQPSLQIPKEAVATKQVAGGGISGKTNLIKFKNKNLLRIETFDEEIIYDSPFGAARALHQAWDFFDVEVTGKDKGVNYLKTEGKTDKAHGKMEYFIQKPSNFYAPAVKNIQKIGIASLNVNGALVHKEVSESSYVSGNMRYTTVTTTTWQFPQLDNKYWNQLLENIYQSIQNEFVQRYGMEFIPVEKITSHPEYQVFFEPREANTESIIRKNYKDTKRLQPGNIAEVFSSASTTFSQDLPEIKLMQDLGLDAIMMISIDLRVSKGNKRKVVLDPVVSYRIVGSQLAFGMSPPPVIAEGVVSGRGVPFSMKEFDDLDALTRITQWERLLHGIHEALAALAELEQQEKYYETWLLAQ